MSDDVLWITEQEVASLLRLPEAITALERSVVLEHEGQARTMTKTMLQYGHSNVHALGGQLASVAGVKSWVHAEAGTCPMLLLWDARDGSLLAAIEAFALGNLRTGSTSGLATKWLAAPGASTLAIMGCGKQAMSQVAAVVAVRPITRVRIWARTVESAERFARRVADEFGVEARACASVQEATDGAAVVTTVSRATEPFLFSRHLGEGVHVNAIGAIGPDREEFGQDLFDRTHTVCADDLAGVKKLSREFGRRYGAGGWEAVASLGTIVADGRSRWQPQGLTLFKAMGMGLSDVALGAAVFERARRAGAGRTFDKPRKAVLDFKDLASAPATE